MEIIIDGADIKTPSDLHDEIEKLSQIEGYGRNLDALYDVLTDLPTTCIVLKNISAMRKNLSSYADSAITAFKDAEENNDGLTVEFK